MHKLITILGPTASGKTNLAVHLADKIDGEIISADSRQVYRGMDIGTGKDLDEFELNGTSIPYHLIDTKEAGYEYNVFEFQQDFIHVFNDITKRGKTPILCGGTGLYLSSALAKEQLIAVPENTVLRVSYQSKNKEELIKELASLKTLRTSMEDFERERIVRALEIEHHKIKHPIAPAMPEIEHHVFGIEIERSESKEKITKRLKDRLDEGMIKEVETLLAQGVSAQQLRMYGLEYRYVTDFIEGELTFNDMFQKLNSAIHLFAKKQMTWFRKMQRSGIEINWLDTSLSVEDKVKKIQHN